MVDETPRVDCLIALGSNLGDRLTHLRAGAAAIGALDRLDIVAVASLYETAPVGGPEQQGPYLNSAILASTTIPAAELLVALHRIEADRNRVRRIRWGPRTLDLDLLTHGDLVSDDPALLVPHPRQHERRFVMVPVCEIAPDITHPALGRTMGDLLAALPPEPGDLTPVATRWHHDDDPVDPRLHEEIE